MFLASHNVFHKFIGFYKFGRRSRINFVTRHNINCCAAYFSCFSVGPHMPMVGLPAVPDVPDPYAGHSDANDANESQDAASFPRSFGSRCGVCHGSGITIWHNNVVVGESGMF